MIDLTLVIQTAIANAISGVIQNIAIFILVIWGIRTIVKKVPIWIEEYWKKRENYLRIEKAVKGGRI